MTTPKLSVNEFKEILKQEIEGCAKSMSWDMQNTSGRGYAFQLWTAMLFCSRDRGFDTDPEDSLLQSNDLGADIVLEDTNQKHILIAQCKYASLSKPPTLDEGEANDFFNRHEHFQNKKWVREHGSEDANEFLGDYQEKIENGYSIDYYFVSTAQASPRTKAMAENCEKRYKKNNLLIKCHLIDFPALKELYVVTHSLDETIPESVEIDLPENKWFRKKDPFDTVIATIKGNSLRGLYNIHKESLFAYNIRGYLGSRGINTKIIATAEDHAEKFFYFNNGISAICTDFTIDNNRLSAKDFQIINGAQTVGAIKRASSNSDLEVLFRLTKTQSVKTEKGMNIDIIRYNNSQNIIKTSDFHSNDPIQMWLEKEFHDKTPYGVLKKVHYVRRRGNKKRAGQSLKFEDLAKIRYSFLFEPTLVHSSPKDLWTHEKDNGSYEQSFGVEGQLLDCWSDKEFRRCLLALVFYWRIDDKLKSEAKEKEDKKPSFPRRLRFHALSLAGIRLQQGLNADQVKKILTNDQEYEKAWEEIWHEVRRVVIDVHLTAIDNKLGMNEFSRSREGWDRMHKRLLAYSEQPHP